MNEVRSKSRQSHASANIRLLGVLLTLSTMLCTIKDDNGELVPTGPQTSNQSSSSSATTESTPSIVATTVDSTYVGIGDTLAISITVYKDSLENAYLPEAQVIVSAPERSWISPDTFTTDGKGNAIAHFSDTAEGSVKLVVSCRDAREEVRFRVTNTPDQVQKLMEVLPDSQSIRADGESFTYINVRVINKDHHPVTGEVVRFASTAGTIVGTNQPAGTQTAGMSVTDKEGKAQAKLISSNVNDTAYVTAFLVSDKSRSDGTRVAFYGVGIELQADSTNLKVGDGTFVTARVLNGANEPIAESPIYLSLGKDTGSNLKITTADSLTGLDGRARLYVKGTTSGTDSIIALAAGARSALTLNVTNLSLSISLGANKLVANRDLSTILKVKFTNNKGTALSDRRIEVIRQYPDADGSPTADTLTAKTDAAGEDTIRIHALPYDATMQLRAIAYNTSLDIASAETSIQFATTRRMTIGAMPPIVQADGSSASQITVQIKNESNNPIVGDKVLFSTTAGVITAEATTSEKGKAVAELTSDRRNVTATVTAVLAGDPTNKATIPVQFAGVEISANAMPRSINSSGTDTSTIVAVLTDANNNPIAGEPVNFRQNDEDSTFVMILDSVTDNRGEARCKVAGIRTGRDTITIAAAGATAQAVIYYSSNTLSIRAAKGEHLIANGHDSTRFVVTYLEGDKKTPVEDASISVSVTIGNLGEVFAQKLTSDADGKASFYVKNPAFPDTATVAVEAAIGSEVTVKESRFYFVADAIEYIRLTATPSVIGTNGDRCRITAIAYDSLDNRVSGARIAFNMLQAPGGGEYLDPPSAVTSADGQAATYLVSGTIPSQFQEVRVVAGDFSSIKSDTARITIAGPPRYITIRTNITKGVDHGDGTFGLPCAAIVTDVNGNPVADGTEVTFSLRATAFVMHVPRAIFHPVTSTGRYNITYDSLYKKLYFEDLNNNFQLDPGVEEDRNQDGLANRGEDINGDGVWNPGPGFEDINGNGVRDSFPEPWKSWSTSVYDSATGEYQVVTGMDFADFNGNNKLDVVEPLLNDTLTWAEYTALSDAVPGGLGFDVDWNNNGVPDPNTAASIARTVQTSEGKAPNMITYGQSDANFIEVTIWAESQGVVTKSPERIILPIVVGKEEE